VRDAHPGTTNERDERFSPALDGQLSFEATSNKYLLNERD